MKRLMIVFAGLLAITACAQTQLTQSARVSIAEFATARVEAQAPMAQLPATIRQSLSLASGLAQTSAPFDPTTRYVRIICEVQCAINASGAAAQPSDIFLPALRPEYFGVRPGTTISVIAAPTTVPGP